LINAPIAQAVGAFFWLWQPDFEHTATKLPAIQQLYKTFALTCAMKSCYGIGEVKP
jgi:hypothetical protein